MKSPNGLNTVILFLFFYKKGADVLYFMASFVKSLVPGIVDTLIQAPGNVWADVAPATTVITVCCTTEVNVTMPIIIFTIKSDIILMA